MASWKSSSSFGAARVAIVFVAPILTPPDPDKPLRTHLRRLEGTRAPAEPSRWSAVTSRPQNTSPASRYLGSVVRSCSSGYLTLCSVSPNLLSLRIPLACCGGPGKPALCPGLARMPRSTAGREADGPVAPRAQRHPAASRRTGTFIERKHSGTLARPRVVTIHLAGVRGVCREGRGLSLAHLGEERENTF